MNKADLRRACALGSTDKLNMEFRSRPDLQARFKHKPYSKEQSDDFKKIFEKELKK